MKRMVSMVMVLVLLLVTVVMPVGATSNTIQAVGMTELAIKEAAPCIPAKQGALNAKSVPALVAQRSSGSTRGSGLGFPVLNGRFYDNIVEGEQNIYDFTMLTANDIDIRKGYSFIITDQFQTDFDLYLYDFTDNVFLAASTNSGFASEEISVYFTSTDVVNHDLVIIVDGYQGNGGYSIYGGPLWKDRTYSGDAVAARMYQASAGFSYRFWTSSIPRSSNYYTLDLSYNTALPFDALIDSFYIDSYGSGNGYGFIKELREDASGGSCYTQVGGDQIQLSGATFYYNNKWNVIPLAIPVRQVWSIRGHIQSSSFLIWRPNVEINYIFPATPGNVRFL